MTLDPRTIIIVNILGTLLMSGGLFVVSLGYLEQINGIRRWSLASLIQCVGWVLFSFRGKMPELVTIILSQAALIISVAMYANILADFTEKKYNRYLPYTVVILNAVGLAYFLWIYPDTLMRIVIISFSSAILLLTSTYILVGTNEKKTASHLLTAAAFAVPAAVMLVRAFYYLLTGDNSNTNPLNSGFFHSVTFLTTYVASVMTTFGFLLMSNDRYVAEHKKAEARILKSEQGLNDAQKLAKVGSWEYNLDTNELIWSKEHYHIFEMDDTPSDKLFELCRKKIHPEDIAAMDEALKIGKTEGRGVIYEHRILAANGEIKHLLGIGEVVAGTDGKKNILRGTVQDITEQKKAEEIAKKYAILEAKSREMEQFAYIASHDLREPLLTIKSFTQLLVEENESQLQEDAANYLQRIVAAANRMDELMRGLLDYSRLSQIKELQKVDCNEIMELVLADLHSLISANKAQITYSQLPVINAYSIELRQLFQNLLSNAIKFRQPEVEPVIHIAAKKSAEVWSFEFKDNGIGVAKADQLKIFNIFQRLHSRKAYPGNGIGLAHCKKIVELHHGTIWVESETNKGATFYFTIAT